MNSSSLLERAATGRSWNPKVACAFALALVFLCGAASGALVMDFGVHNRHSAPAFDTSSGKALYFERMQRELDLTPAQSEQIRSVLDDFWQYYRTVLSDSKQRVEQLLNPEQRQKFEKMLQQQQPR
jgi:Spy/CpxP family protein refolding chaperone